MSKQDLINKFIRFYKSAHGTKPKNLNFPDWTMRELQIGIDGLEFVIRKQIAQGYQDSIHLRG